MKYFGARNKMFCFVGLKYLYIRWNVLPQILFVFANLCVRKSTWGVAKTDFIKPIIPTELSSHLVTLRRRNILVEREGWKWIYEISYIWTAKKDVNFWLIIADHCLSCVYNCDDQSCLRSHRMWGEKWNGTIWSVGFQMLSNCAHASCLCLLKICTVLFSANYRQFFHQMESSLEHSAKMQQQETYILNLKKTNYRTVGNNK